MTRSVVAGVRVVGDGQGGLDVSWEPAGGPVEIAVGHSPDAIDRVVVVVTDGNRATVRGLDAGRHYVSVTPEGGSGVVAAERVLPLEGATNFRDLGGYRAAEGWTRWGMVFRSDAPHRLTTADLAAVDRLGLRVVYDLRTDAERDHSPSALPAALRRELLAIGGDADRTGDLADLFRQGVADDFLVTVYQDMVDTSATTLGSLMTALAESPLPALFHCTAGKDRTGMAAALLLSVLGVDEATVLDDYELSAIHFTDRRQARFTEQLGLDERQYRAVFGAPRQAMASTLTALRERHGSIEDYLVERAGVRPDAIATLRERLIH